MRPYKKRTKGQHTISEKISGAKKNEDRAGIKELRNLAGKKVFDVF